MYEASKKIKNLNSMKILLLIKIFKISIIITISNIYCKIY